MQNVLLGAFGYELTGSTVFVGVLFFAQLGPLLFMSTVGGVLADVVDRRKLLIITQLEQLVLSIVLAGLAASGDPSRVALVVCVFAIGVGNSLSAPAIAAILPTLVPRADLPGARRPRRRARLWAAASAYPPGRQFGQPRQRQRRSSCWCFCVRAHSRCAPASGQIFVACRTQLSAPGLRATCG
jgi:MFS family permease